MGKYRTLIIAGIIILALAAFFLFVPMRDLSEDNVATILVEKARMPRRPREAKVTPPQDVIKWMDKVRAKAEPKKGEDKGAVQIKWEDLKDLDKPYAEFKNEAISILSRKDVSHEVKIYILWWLQHYSDYELSEPILAACVKPEYYDKLPDKAHCLLLAKVLSDEVAFEEFSNTMNELGQLFDKPRGKKRLKYSKSFVRKMAETEVALLRKAAEMPPRDEFSALLNLYAAMQEEDQKGGVDIGLFMTDEENAKYTPLFWPYMEKFLATKSGWLVAEPKWFAYMKSNDKIDNQIGYYVMSDATGACWELAMMAAPDAVSRKDWPRIVALLGGIQHLSDLYPKGQVLFEQGFCFGTILDAIPEDAGSQTWNSELRTLKDEWDSAVQEFFKRGFEGFSLMEGGFQVDRPTGVAAEVDKQNHEIYLNLGENKLNEMILRLKKLVSELH